MTKEQIVEALVPVYNAAYDDYHHLSELSGQLLRGNEKQAGLALERMAAQKSCYLDGLKAAAEALGIPSDELMAAASQGHTNQVQDRRDAENG